MMMMIAIINGSEDGHVLRTFFALVSKCVGKNSSKIRMHAYQSFILSTDSPAHLSWQKVHLFLF